MNRTLREDYHRKADIFLRPGELAITTKPLIIKTLLGSCVSIIFYHPKTGISGISHALLPSENSQHELNCKNCVHHCLHEKNSPRFRFVNCAIMYMYEQFKSHGIKHKEIVVKLFGGAKTIGGLKTDIGVSNVEAARAKLKSLNLIIDQEDVLGSLARTLSFDTATGYVIVKKQKSKII